MPELPAPNPKRLEHYLAMLAHDSAYPAFGVSLAGMDEAGRGPLFGCVMAACVILPSEPLIPWIDDSKKLSAKRREAVYDEITAHALYARVGEASVQEIDALNILNATRLAMERAAQEAPATLCLIDAVTSLHLPFPQKPLLHGDAISYHIAAASIVAKVTRDRKMLEMSKQYPNYGIERHMGYGTALHLEALRRYGPCPEHRKTFLKNL